MDRVVLAVGPTGMPANPLDPLPGAQVWLAVLSRPLTRFPRRRTVGHVSDLQPGDPIEFGADIPPVMDTTTGRTTYRDCRRWCGVVLEVSPTALVVQPSRDDFAALSAAVQWREEHQPRPKEWWEEDDAADSVGAEPAA